MSSPRNSKRPGAAGAWPRELLFSGIALVTGFALLPGLIFFVGASVLGRYEDASALRVYQSVYGGLAKGSIASWVVLLGPYGFYLLFKALKAIWHVGAKSA